MTPARHAARRPNIAARALLAVLLIAAIAAILGAATGTAVATVTTL